MKKTVFTLSVLFIFIYMLFLFRVIGYGYKIFLSRNGEQQKVEVWDGKYPDQRITIYLSSLKNPILISGSAENLADPIETNWFKVKFKDETIKPGRVVIDIHGHTLDFMPDSVSIDGVKHEWKSIVKL